MRMSPNATRGASESRRLVRASRVGLLGVTGALPISGSGDIGEAMRGSLSTPPSGRRASPLQAPAAKADGSGALAPLLGRVCLARRYLLESVFHLKIPMVATPESGQQKRAPNLGGGRAARDDRAP